MMTGEQHAGIKVREIKTCVRHPNQARPLVHSRRKRQPSALGEPDGSDRKVIVTNCRLPDGTLSRRRRTHLLDQLGVPNLNDGSIERADLDGRNRKTIISARSTFTPKQLQIDKENSKL